MAPLSCDRLLRVLPPPPGTVSPRLTLNTVLLGLPETVVVSGQEHGLLDQTATPGGILGQVGMAAWGWTLRAQLLLPLRDRGQKTPFLGLGFLICRMRMNPASCGTVVSSM